MSNQLTGPYDAVVQIHVETINRILALLHQRGSHQDALPSFPHSFAVRLDSADAEIERALVSKFGDWVSVIPVNWSGEGTEKVPRSLDKSPPGISRAITEINEMVAELKDDLQSPQALRGTAQVQVSTPTIEVPHNSTSEMAVSVQLRAHYMPDPNTPSLPERIHGELRLRFFIQIKTLGNKTVLEETLTGHSDKIQFSPATGTGLSVHDTARIESEIRRVLDENFEMNLELPNDFRFRQFKGLGSGTNAVLALPAKLTPPFHDLVDGLNGLANNFLNSSDGFAVAVSKEHVNSVFASVKSSISGFPTIKISIWVFYLLVPIKHTYTIKVSNVHDLKWSNGQIEFAVEFSIKGPAVNLNPMAKQKLGVTLNASSQTLTFHRIGSPQITGIPGIVPGSVVNDFKSQIAAKIDSELQNLQFALPALDDEVKQFSQSLSASYSSVEISSHGFIIRGALATGSPAPVVVEFTEKSDGTGFSALQSWIPGGTIERFEWTWVTSPSWVPWVQTKKTKMDEHEFILRLTPDRTPDPIGAHQLCLRVVGQQLVGGAHPVSDADGEGCHVYSGPYEFEMPYWWGRINAPIWLPDPPPEEIMDNAIVAHVNTLAHSRDTTAPGVNTIVHFADQKWSTLR